MCRFKSGIILKSKVIVAQGEDDSHSALLDGLGIRDDYIGASKTFVRAELIPIGDKWWADPEKNPEQWKFIVDQDITPEWFSREAGEKEFREAVCSWWKKHVIVGGEFGELNDGHYYRMKDCKVKKLCGNTSVMLYKSMVKEMYGSATVQEMHGNATVKEMCGNATVLKMCGNAMARCFESLHRAKIYVPKGSKIFIDRI